MTWIPIAALTFAAISVSSIAIMIVLSLIPIYITTNDFSISIRKFYYYSI